MNVALLLSGGVGKRAGFDIPKQYMDLCGKPVIEYVIDAVLESKLIDELVIVMDEEYLGYIKEKNNPKIHFVPNGQERLYSVMNGLNYINSHFDAERLIIVQAVSPLITANIIDSYIALLTDYDVVTTATKCTGELFEIDNYHRIDRNKFYFCQSPEAFRFKDLYRYINPNSEYSELIYHYPSEPKICFYTGFEYNIKLTYKSDLRYCEFLMKEKTK